jgi:hypothetical protein
LRSSKRYRCFSMQVLQTKEIVLPNQAQEIETK